MCLSVSLSKRETVRLEDEEEKREEEEAEGGGTIGLINEDGRPFGNRDTD